MIIGNYYPECVPNVFEKYFSNFYFLNVDISLTMHDPSLKLYMCIKNIVIEGTVSQIFDRKTSYRGLNLQPSDDSPKALTTMLAVLMVCHRYFIHGFLF